MPERLAHHLVPCTPALNLTLDKPDPSNMEVEVQMTGGEENFMSEGAAGVAPLVGRSI